MACTSSAVTRKSRASLISRASTSPAEYGVCTAGGLKRKSPKRILRSGAFANSLRWFAHWQTVRFHAQKKKASVWAGYFIFKVVGRKPLISIDWLWSTKLMLMPHSPLAWRIGQMRMIERHRRPMLRESDSLGQKTHSRSAHCKVWMHSSRIVRKTSSPGKSG
jgi:hypothetical protein